MPEYRNELVTAFTGRVDASFAKAADSVAQSLTRLAGGANSLKRATTGLEQTNKAMETGATVGRKYSSAVGGVSGALQNLARYAFAGAVIGGVTRSFTSGISAIISYDQALRNLQAITNESFDTIQGLGAEIINVSNNTKFSAAEIADAAVILGQAGLSAGEIQGTLASVAKLATGTLTDLSTTADIVTTAMRSFGIAASDSGRIVDVFAASVNSSKLNIDKLRVAFGYVAPVAAQSGISFEQTAAAMGLLANNGLRASTIGTSLRRIFAILAEGGSKLEKAISKVGLTLADVNPQTVGLEKALINVAKAIRDPETGALDTAKAFEIFQKQGATAIAVLTKAVTSGDFEKIYGQITEVGAASRQAETQIQGLELQLKNLQDRWANVAVALGESGATGVLRGVIQLLSNLGLILQQGINTTLGSFITSIVGVTTALTALSLVTPVVVRGLIALRAAFLAINPVVGIIAIAAAGLTALANESDRVVKELNIQEQQLRGLISGYQGVSKSVDALIEKQRKGINVSKEISVLTDRLIQQYPDLAAEIELTNGNLEKLNKLLREQEKASTVSLLETLTQKQAELNEQYAIAIKQRSDVKGADIFLGETIKQAPEATKELQALSKNGLLQVNLAAKSVIRGILTFNEALSAISSEGDTTGAVSRRLSAAIRTISEELNTTNIVTAESVDIVADLGQEFVRIGERIAKGANPEKIVAFNKIIEDTRKSIEELSETTLTTDQQEIAAKNLKAEAIKKINDLFKISRQETRELTSAIKEQIKADNEAYETKRKSLEIDRKSNALNESEYIRQNIILTKEQAAVQLANLIDLENAELASAKNRTAIQQKYAAARSKLEEETKQKLATLDAEYAQEQKDTLDDALSATLIYLEDELASQKEINDVLRTQLELRIANAKTAEEAARYQVQLNEINRTETGTVLDGIKRKFKELGQEQKSAFEIGQEVTDTTINTLTDGLGTALSSTELKFENLGETILQVFTDAINAASQYIIKQLLINALVGSLGSSSGGGIGDIFGSLFGSSSSSNIIPRTEITGVSGRHSGGRMTDSTQVLKHVDPSIFIGAPRYHSGGTVAGLGAGEVPAILKEGERVLTEDEAKRMDKGSAQSVSVQIRNDSNEPLRITKSESTLNLGQQVIEIVVDSINRNRGGLRETIASART